jgi:DNA-binding NtrC family response regulator
MDRILVVEDDVEVRPLLEHILLDNGFQVATAENVAIATTLLNSQPFDLVICDVKLPDGSGLAVADKAIAAGVKTLVITGHGWSLKPGSLTPYDYLLKPLRAPELLNNIDRCLAH